MTYSTIGTKIRFGGSSENEMRYSGLPLSAWAAFIVAMGCGNQRKNEVASDQPTMPAEHRQAVRDHTEKHRTSHFDHRFEKAKDWESRFDDPKRDAWQKPHRVIELLKIEPGMLVADIGAGTGYFLPHLSLAVGKKGKVLAVDIEDDMVWHMRERAKRDGLDNVTAQKAEPTAPGLEAASLDRIIIVNTWHHIPDRRDYSKKIGKALKEGGMVAIIDYTKEAPFGPPPNHRLTPTEVIAELAEGGLKATTLEEDLPHQYIVAGTRE